VKVLRLSGMKVRYDSSLSSMLSNFQEVLEFSLLHCEIGDPHFFKNLSQGMRKLKKVLLSNVNS